MRVEADGLIVVLDSPLVLDEAGVGEATVVFSSLLNPRSRSPQRLLLTITLTP